MLRYVLFSLMLFVALGAAPVMADPTPAPSEAPSAAPATAGEPSPAPVQGAPATSAPAGGAAEPSGSPVPGPAPSADQAVTVRAMDWLHRLQTGDIDRTQLALEFNRVLTPERVKLIGQQVRSLGKVKSYAYTGQTASHGIRGYQFSVEFAAAKYLYLFEVDEKDQVAGILLTPPK